MVQVPDNFYANNADDTASARNFGPVVLSDVVNFVSIPRSIRANVAGNVMAVREDGTVVSFLNVAAGEILWIRPIRINLTNTTATDLVWME